MTTFDTIPANYIKPMQNLLEIESHYAVSTKVFHVEEYESHIREITTWQKTDGQDLAQTIEAAKKQPINNPLILFIEQIAAISRTIDVNQGKPEAAISDAASATPADHMIEYLRANRKDLRRAYRQGTGKIFRRKLRHV